MTSFDPELLIINGELLKIGIEFSGIDLIFLEALGREQVLKLFFSYELYIIGGPI